MEAIRRVAAKLERLGPEERKKTVLRAFHLS
jgi:hypothetical protein